MHRTALRSGCFVAGCLYIWSPASRLKEVQGTSTLSEGACVSNTHVRLCSRTFSEMSGRASTTKQLAPFCAVFGDNEYETFFHGKEQEVHACATPCAHAKPVGPAPTTRTSTSTSLQLGGSACRKSSAWPRGQEPT
jgi:hypothetical protein